MPRLSVVAFWASACKANARWIALPARLSRAGALQIARVYLPTRPFVGWGREADRYFYKGMYKSMYIDCTKRLKYVHERAQVCTYDRKYVHFLACGCYKVQSWKYKVQSTKYREHRSGITFASFWRSAFSPEPGSCAAALLPAPDVVQGLLSPSSQSRRVLPGRDDARHIWRIDLVSERLGRLTVGALPS